LESVTPAVATMPMRWGELIAVELLSFELRLGPEGIEHAFVQRQVCH